MAHAIVASRVGAALLAAALLVVGWTAPAAAHDPIFFSDEQTTPETGPFLPDGTISFALYGDLAGPGDSRGFQVQFAEGDRLLMELLVPNRAPENALEVEELPSAVVTAPDGSTFELTPETLAIFDEPFSGTSYVRLATVEGLAQAGVYDVIVTAPGPLRFTAVVGVTETFLTPVERVENRVTSSDGVTAPLQQWYETPVTASPPDDDRAEPPTATPTPATRPEATPTPATTPEETSTPEPQPTASPTPPVELAQPESTVSAADDGSSRLALVALGLGGLVGVGAMVTVLATRRQ